VSDWKNAFRSFYFETAEPPENPELKPSETALLVIDIQNTYLEVSDVLDPFLQSTVVNQGDTSSLAGCIGFAQGP